MLHKLFKNFLIIFTLGITLVSVVGCKSRSVQLTEADNGKSFSIGVGDSLVITLPGNPSTGYSWEVKSVDSTILVVAGEAQFVSDNTNMVGSGGTLTFTFDAKKTGSSTLELVYLRPWETGVDPLGTFTIQVVVE
jgi:inhibitor of cysteine peptidase